MLLGSAINGPSDDPDDGLMSRYRQGDATAFAELYERHHRSVYHFARLMLADASFAEEVLQETFLAVARSAARYEHQGRFRPWVLRICRNCCLNRLASERLRRGRSLESLDEDEMPGAQGAPVDQLADAREQLGLVEQGIRTLPASQREAVLLYAMDGMAYAEIAEVMGVPVNTVKTLIHRGRSALAELLRQQNGSDFDE